MGRAWADHREPDRIPSESILYFGADPCHSPDREGQPRATCATCGGAYEAPNGRIVPRLDDLDPIRDYDVAVTTRGRVSADGAVGVCAGCHRSTRDGTAALDRVGRPIDRSADADRGDRAGRTAAAVADDAGPGRPPTRREKRAAMFGRGAGKTGR